MTSPKMLYRTRKQAWTGKLVVQKRQWGPAESIPQAEGIYQWIDCSEADADDIKLTQARRWVLLAAEGSAK